MATEYTGEVIPFKEYTGEVVPIEPVQPKRSMSQRIARWMLQSPAAPYEAVKQAVGGVLSGYAGMGAGVANMMGAKIDPAETVQRVQESFSPKTEPGQTLTAGLNYPMQQLADYAQGRGDRALEATGNPWAATAANLSIQGIPELLSRGLGGVAERSMARAEDVAALARRQNSARDAGLTRARDAGYVIPPEMANRDTLSGVIESGPGKVKIQQKASLANQETTNKLVRADLGMPEGVAITPERLNDIRAQEYEKYKALIAHDYGTAEVSKPAGFRSEWETIPTTSTRKLGIVSTQEFQNAIGQAFSRYDRLAKEYPNTFKSSEIEGLRSDFLKKEQPIDTMLDGIKELRADATKNLQNKETPGKARAGFVQIDIANAMENLIEQNLERTGKPELITEFRKARQMIAKTYDVEKALNWTTGDVSAQRLAMLSSKRPLSGGLSRAADFAKQFPKVAQDVNRIGSVPYYSPWDMAFAAGSLATGHPLAAVSELAARGAIPGLTLSKMYQDRFVKPPSYGPGLGRSVFYDMTRPEAAFVFLPAPGQAEQPQ